MGEFEPAASRVKWLRQGRGNGFRDALRVGDSAAGDVLGCVLDDPRWDRQVEQRDEYYARLLLALDADIRALEERVLDEGPRDDADFWLPIGVLAEMARRGHARPGNAIATAIRRGLRWRACLDALDAAGGEPLIGAVVRAEDVVAMIGRIDLDGLVRAVQTVAAPWAAWAGRHGQPKCPDYASSGMRGLAVRHSPILCAGQFPGSRRASANPQIRP
jgi:hypothetical protein